MCVFESEHKKKQRNCESFSNGNLKPQTSQHRIEGCNKWFKCAVIYPQPYYRSFHGASSL